MNKPRAWCELIRLPNVFTAMADILAGYWLASQAMVWSWRLAALLVASAALYSAGIVLNDLRDIEIDRIERPNRPLPSGRVGVREARVLAAILCAVGLGAATAAGVHDDALLWGNRTAGVAVLLLGAVVAYDLALKSTALGPFAMGACRGLNILLPMTVVLEQPTGPHGLAPIALFVFVAAITCFGGAEAGSSSPGRLIVATAGIVASLLILFVFVAWNASEDSLTLVIWLALAFHFLRVAVRAVRRPESPVVQYAMKTFILGIIAIDAMLATSAAGWPAGALVLALLVPALVFGKWVYST